MNSVPAGIGIGLPKKCLLNADLPKELETSDEWIVQRTGIRQRYLVSGDETTASLATEAARNALNSAGISPNEVDLTIIGTVTGDYTFPSTAAIVQRNIGAGGVAFDLGAACSGFIFGLNTADLYIKSGKAKCALVIGADTFSKILDWSDRSSCVLFGDGAGAMVLRGEEKGERGVKFCKIYSDGKYADYLITDGGVSTTRKAGTVKMQGREVFKFSVEKFCESLEELLKNNDMTVKDIDLLVPHQANARIIQKIAEKFGIEERKVLINIDKYANTSAASIPLALKDAEGMIFTGGSCKNVVLLSMGAGFTWGSA
ncbi:MAG: ketoacyl-ACP synthase III, partial [Holosporaceae bacterium]|nr:ketoacyl-ACP synthase III [Holosporaceae bacterium]